MKKLKGCLFLGLGLLLISCGESKIDTEEKPNIVYILADDLGYGELGVYGQKLIETPHIDALAKQGMLFTNHYTGAPVCAPARSVLLTGLHSGHTHIRGNDEWAERGDIKNMKAVLADPSLEGQRPLLDSIITVAEVLKTQGYRTGVFGKWGLGAPNTEGVANKQGFDYFYGYNCQRQAHSYYPQWLWKNEERVMLDNKYVAFHANLKKGADINNPESYSDFRLNEYSATLIHDEAISFIERNKNQPFFLYYASPIPHVPLQAPQKWVTYYQNKFGPEKPYTGGSYFPNRTPLAAYAAMISYLDEQVGELIAKLKEEGVYENTLIIFTSDNGPTFNGGTKTPHFESAKPFKSERGWGKGYLHEGGIRVPMIATWKGKVKPGTTSDHISSFYDVMATLSDVSGAIAPDNDGISFLPTLIDKKQKAHEFLYWEFPQSAYGGQQAVRMGEWKGIRKNILKGNMKLELYNLSNDIQEQTNVADEFPEIVKKMEEIMKSEHTTPVLDKFKIKQLGD